MLPALDSGDDIHPDATGYGGHGQGHSTYPFERLDPQKGVVMVVC